MFRVDVSKPVSLALAAGVIQDGRSFFDFGCGRGTDVAALQAAGIQAGGWDPVHFPHESKAAADIVNLGYVINVIENPSEREEVLRQAWKLSQRALVVAARLDWDIHVDRAVPASDGLITARGTFQKFFTQHELQTFIETVLGVQADAAAPGVFYVFRSPEDREAHLSRGVRMYRQAAAAMPPAVSFDHNRDILEPLHRFLIERGRAPVSGELEGEQQLVQRLGSLNRALRLLSRVADPRTWERAAIARQRDLLVYLALGSFRRRPKFGVLPKDLQVDIRLFFGSYAEATRLGRELLFAAGQQQAISEECAKASVGKLTPEALYVHVSALQELPVLLRVYEGCGRMLLGDVEGATLVKLRRDKPKISYLCYPAFHDDAHPVLAQTFVADLRALRTYHRSYAGRENPPILHRKECFVSKDYPMRDAFAALTEAEADAGLLAGATEIGTLRAWQERLSSRGFTVEGHHLRRTELSMFASAMRMDSQVSDGREGEPPVHRALEDFSES
jgi:DNA phosphorothioation-associated putative methyltransferase